MKRMLQATLEYEDVIELMRILMDEEPEGALLFIQKHFKGKVRELLEGG